MLTTSSARRTLFVQTQTTPNPNSLQFIPGTPVLSSGGTHEFLNLKAALASPLALKLMGIEGVASVFYGPDFVSVQKDDETPWAVIKPEVFSLVMEHFSSGAPLFKDQQQPGVGDDGEPEDTRILDSDSEVVATVKELIATRIRPSIMEDGGDLEFKGFDEQTGVVRVKLKGSCRGCSSSEVTLKSGIERMLMHYVPEVTTVEQVRGSRWPPSARHNWRADNRIRFPVSQILDDEEVVALDEFAKFEARLAEKASKAAATDSSRYVFFKSRQCGRCLKHADQSALRVHLQLGRLKRIYPWPIASPLSKPFPLDCNPS